MFRFLAPALLLLLGTSAATAVLWMGCTGRAFDAGCPNLGNLQHVTALGCQAKCLATRGCTAVNFGGGDQCSLRACPARTPPTWPLASFTAFAMFPMNCTPPPPPPKPPPPPPPPPVVFGFRFATTHSDHMVLQAAPQRSRVWGFSAASAAAVKVCVSNSAAGCDIDKVPIDDPAWITAAMTPGVQGLSLGLISASAIRRPTCQHAPSSGHPSCRMTLLIFISLFLSLSFSLSLSLFLYVCVSLFSFSLSLSFSLCLFFFLSFVAAFRLQGPDNVTRIFTATLPVMPPSPTPYTITAVEGTPSQGTGFGGAITLSEVVFGDV